MSHFTSIHTQIRDLAAPQDACKELGVELVREGEARGYAGNTRSGDHHWAPGELFMRS